jgi:hypothetical protein
MTQTKETKIAVEFEAAAKGALFFGANRAAHGRPLGKEGEVGKRKAHGSINPGPGRFKRDRKIILASRFLEVKNFLFEHIHTDQKLEDECRQKWEQENEKNLPSRSPNIMAAMRASSG